LIKPLAAGIDTLYWSTMNGIDSDRFMWLERLREKAKRGEPQVLDLNGHVLSVEPHGSGHYPVLVTCAEFSVQLTASAQIPTAYVQLRSAFLHEVGPRAAFTSSAVVVRALCGRQVGPAQASRLDIYADFGGWVLTDADRRGLVARAKLHPVLRTGSDEYETLRVGTSPMVVRLYRKDIETRSRAGFADAFWGGYAGPVVRVEAQASSVKLREVGISSVDDALESFGTLWQRATGAFCVLRVPGDGTPESWPVREEWRAVQALAFGPFPQAERVPVLKLEREELRVARVLLGSLASWAAIHGLFDPAGALTRLRERYPELVTRRDRTFAEAVLRHHVRLPRSIRQAQAKSWGA